MIRFSVFFVCWTGAFAIELGSPDGLHFNYDGEYASTYDNYKPRDYKFEYGVSDPHTGDHKQHWEVRENGIVRGAYSLLEPDGTTRIVEYTADKHNGFRAVVKRIGHAIHPQPIAHIPETKVLTVPEVIHSLPYATSSIEASPYYKSYDGGIENYANIIDDASFLKLSSLSSGINGQSSSLDLPVLHEAEQLVLNHEPIIKDDISSINQLQQGILELPQPTILQESEPLLPYHGEPIISHESAILSGHEVPILNHEEPIISHEGSILLTHDPIIKHEEPLLLNHEPVIISPEESIIRHEKVIGNLHSLGGGLIESSIGDSLTGIGASSYIGLTGNLEDDSEYKNY